MRYVCFRRAAVAGFFATFIMTVTGLWQSGVGLPRMDVGAMLMAGINGPMEEGAEPMYGIAWGQAAHFLNGVILAFIYAMWLYDRLPGPGVVKGAIYGVITTLIAGLAVVPIVTAAAGQPAGVLFANTENAVMRIIGALVTHLAYGVALGVGYRHAHSSSENRAGQPDGRGA